MSSVAKGRVDAFLWGSCLRSSIRARFGAARRGGEHRLLPTVKGPAWTRRVSLLVHVVPLVLGVLRGVEEAEATMEQDVH
mmetsp:Transcript_6761/g.9183  ORF Transcript_6761/g.9183 Transcript_6761/m.9183 type:complete len:80 (-) Transcript_6761:65-304(-)